jgi:hypothetical protein
MRILCILHSKLHFLSLPCAHTTSAVFKTNSLLLEAQLSTITTLAVSAYQNNRFACGLRLLAVLVEQVLFTPFCFAFVGTFL